MVELLPYLDFTTLLLLGCITLSLWWIFKKPKNVIPGPRGMPYIGSMFDIIKNVKAGTLVDYTVALHNRYGHIVGVNAGVQRFVFINDGYLLAELFGHEEFNLRPVEKLPSMKALAHGTPRGLFFGNGESHKEMRRFALLSLRDFGVGKKSLDEMIQTEASILCQHLEKLADTKDGIMSDLKIKMQYATANIIHHIIFGYRQEYEDPKWQILVQKLYDFFAINPLTFPENFLPIAGKIPGLTQYLTDNMMDKFLSVNDYLEKYLDSQIEEHRSTYSEGEIRDFIDSYLQYELEHKEFYTKENIFAVMLDLFRAGTDTAATTLTWSIMYLVRQPDIQRQLREEIDEVVGDHMFDRKDKAKLVKTRAFLNEIHRYVSVAQVATPHTAEKPVDVRSVTIMPDDIILASLYAIHHDKDYWGDPFTFRIDRWLNESGELLKHEGHFLPFSVGKRACPGRQLATIEVMLILVEFLQNFTFEEAEGYSDMTDLAISGIVRSPKSFHFKVLKRQ